jgi:hypothetical protein
LARRTENKSNHCKQLYKLNSTATGYSSSSAAMKSFIYTFFLSICVLLITLRSVDAQQSLLDEGSSSQRRQTAASPSQAPEVCYNLYLLDSYGKKSPSIFLFLSFSS